MVTTGERASRCTGEWTLGRSGSPLCLKSAFETPLWVAAFFYDPLPSEVLPFEVQWLPAECGGAVWSRSTWRVRALLLLSDGTQPVFSPSRSLCRHPLLKGYSAVFSGRVIWRMRSVPGEAKGPRSSIPATCVT